MLATIRVYAHELLEVGGEAEAVRAGMQITTSQSASSPTRSGSTAA